MKAQKKERSHQVEIKIKVLWAIYNILLLNERSVHEIAQSTCFKWELTLKAIPGDWDDEILKWKRICSHKIW
jgi:hypothetical protein